MKILITGIHGFVGTNLVASLEKQYTIYGLDIISPVVAGVEYTYSWNDLDNGVIPQVDVIIHLAGKASDTMKQSERQAYFDINTGLTTKIYDYFLRSQAKKFVFFSSVKAAANKISGRVLTEDVFPMPKGGYGESKLKAEEYIQNKWDTNKSIYIIRPCMIYGVGCSGNLKLLYDLVKRGFPWPLGDFENRRTFTSIDNLCYAIKALLASNIESGVYNIADDESLSTNELIRLICDVIDSSPHIWRINKSLIRAVARIGDFLHFPLNVERLSKLTESYVVSNQKIKDALGMERMPGSAKEGLERTIRSFSKESI